MKIFVTFWTISLLITINSPQNTGDKGFSPQLDAMLMSAIDGMYSDILSIKQGYTELMTFSEETVRKGKSAERYNLCFSQGLDTSGKWRILRKNSVDIGVSIRQVAPKYEYHKWCFLPQEWFILPKLNIAGYSGGGHIRTNNLELKSKLLETVNANLSPIRELEKAKNADEVANQLVAEFDKADKKTQCQILRRLELIQAESTLPFLISLLNSDDDNIVMATIDALKGFNDTRTIEPLLKIVKRGRKNQTSAGPALRAALKLSEITYQYYDMPYKKWRAWWRTNRDKTRNEWRQMAFKQALKQLKEKRAKNRRRGLLHLRRIGGKRAVPEITTRLNDRDEGVRCTAAIVLGQLSDKTAIPALKKALSDSSKGVVLESAEALGKLGDNSGVPVLLEMIDEKPGAVLHSLSRIGDVSIAPRPLKLLEHHDIKVQRAACWAFCSLTDTSFAFEAFKDDAKGRQAMIAEMIEWWEANKKVILKKGIVNE